MKKLLFAASLSALALLPSWAQVNGSQADTPGATSAPASTTPSSGSPAPATPPTPPAPSKPQVSVSAEQPPAPQSEVPKPTHLSTRELRRIEQQEVLRRQELSYRADQATTEGRKAELAENYPRARQYYVYAAQALGSISRSSVPYQRASAGLARVDLHLHQDAQKQGNTELAHEVLAEAADYNPNNLEVTQALAKLNLAMKNPSDTSLLGNPAVTPDFIKKVNQVQQDFAEAEQFRRTGQWDLATDRLNKILGLDPFNRTAISQLKRIEEEKSKYYETARLEMRDERLRQVEENWYVPIQNPEVETGVQAEQPELVRQTNFTTEQALKSILVTIKFDAASIEQAADYLSQQSKQQDPQGRGVQFLVQPDAASTARRVDLRLQNALPLGDALRYICQIAGVKYKIQDYGISIIPLSQSNFDLVRRTFIVPPSFFSAQSDTTATSTSGASDTGGAGPQRPLVTLFGNFTPSADSATSIQAILEKKGISFPPGASALYNPVNQQLTVVNTPDSMEFIEELANGSNAPTLMVRVSTKFVEINQEDLDDFTVNSFTNLFGKNATGPGFNGATVPYKNTGFSPNALNQTHPAQFSPIQTPTYVSNLRGVNGTAQTSVGTLLNGGATPPENFLSLRAMVGPINFGFLFTSLSQKKSFDLLSDPSAMVKSGETAEMDAVRQFPYPTNFQKPETITPLNQNNGTTTTTIFLQPPTVIPSFPTEFTTRNVGVTLSVTPQINPDEKNISLIVNPQVTDFQGFINYGSPIDVVENDSGGTVVLSPNFINQPIFNNRTIHAKVIVHDGSTLIMGGLMREDIQEVNDKVPVLGDIPLIGRLFQSKAKHSIKRNLIIFVTASIYRNDGELLNPPETINAADVLTHGSPLSSTASPSASVGP